MKLPLLLAAALALFPAAAPAQHVICCNLLVDVKGDWIGASRQCRQSLEQASAAQRRSACQQLGRSACEEVAPFCQPCTGNEAKNAGGDALGPGDAAYDGLVDGARAAGIAGFGPQHIGVQDRGDGLIRYQIRLGADGCALPNGNCILWAGENGHLPPGKQEGARHMLLGSIQVAGNVVRVNGRYVNVETGVIEGSARADAGGNDRAAIAAAMAEMLKSLGLRCDKARGLEY